MELKKDKKLKKIIVENLPPYWEKWDGYYMKKLENFHNHEYNNIIQNPIIQKRLASFLKEDLKDSSWEFFEKNKSEIFYFLQGIRNGQIKMIPEIRSLFGMSQQDLIQESNQLISHLIEKNLLSNLESDSYDWNSFGIHMYSPINSFLIKYFDENSNKRIIEIGCGAFGVGNLSYLQDRGFEVEGLERRTLDENLIKKSEVKVINGSWHEIDKFFEKESVDAFYFNFMTPSPYIRTPYLDEENWHLSHSNFGKAVSTKMHSLLKKDGLVINRDLGDKYISEFLFCGKKEEFEFSKIPIESYGKIQDYNFLDKTQLEKGEIFPLENNKEGWNFGSKLFVSQKI